MDVHGELDWKEIPQWLHHLNPNRLPHKGHARIQANARFSQSHQNIDCVVDSKALTWNLPNNHQLSCSGIIFYNRNQGQENIQLDHLKIHTAQHSIFIDDAIRIHKDQEQRWDILDSVVHIGNGTCSLSGHLGHASSDFKVEWKDIDLGVLAATAGIKDVTGTCFGYIKVSKSIDNPLIDMSLVLPQMTYQKKKFNFLANITQS